MPSIYNILIKTPRYIEGLEHLNRTMGVDFNEVRVQTQVKLEALHVVFLDMIREEQPIEAESN